MKDKVAVIGAGTAGLILAKNTAEAGIDTVVYDQKNELGIPVRASGILSIRGLNNLGIDYSRGVTNTLFGARIHGGSRTMSIVAKKPMARVLDRKILNDICEELALKAGATVQKGVRVNDAMLDKLAKERIIVGADGAVSSVARHYNMGAVSNYITTYKADFNVDVKDTGIVDLFFDQKLAPGLFAWLCPNAKDILEVGIGLDSRFGNAKRAFDKFLGMEEVVDLLENSKKIDEGASIIPIGLRKKIVDERREVLLVGDAAGQIKHTTGGGIIFGSNAAIIAARTIKSHLKKGTKLSLYDKAFKMQFKRDMLLHAMIHNLYSSMSAERIGTLIGMLHSLGVDRFLGDYGDMDRPSLVIKRFFLRGLAD